MVKGEWASAWHCAIAFEDFNLSMTKNASAKIVNGYSPTEATGNIPGCRLRSSVRHRLSVSVLRYCRSNIAEHLIPCRSKHLPRAFWFHWRSQLVVCASERLGQNRFDEDSEGRCQKKRAHRTDYRIAELGSWVRGSRQLDSRLVRDSTSAGRREKTAGES